MSDLDKHAPAQGTDAVQPPDLYPDEITSTIRQAIAAEDIEPGDIVYRGWGVLLPGQVGKLTDIQAAAGVIPFGVATTAALRWGIVEIETRPASMSGNPPISDDSASLPPPPAYVPGPDGFPVDLKDDTALASYLKVGADDFLSLADYADALFEDGTAEAVDYWRMIAAITRNRALPIGNLLAVLAALTGGSLGNG